MFRRILPSVCLALIVGMLGAWATSSHADRLWPADISALERTLSTGTPEQRRIAALEVSRVPTHQAEGLIRRFISDDDSEVRTTLATLSIARRIEDLNEVGLNWLQSSEARERLLGTRLLKTSFGDNEVQRLGPLVTDLDKVVRLSAVAVLGSSPPELERKAAEFLLTALSDNEPEVRAAAARSLGILSVESTSIPLAGHLQDTDEIVRLQVARALGVIANRSAVPGLLVALGDVDAQVRAAAAEALALCGDKRAVPGLLEVLSKFQFSSAERAALVSLAKLDPTIFAQQLEELSQRASFKTHAPDVLALSQVVPHLDLAHCLEQSVLSSLDFCARLHVAMGGDLFPLLRAVDEHRLSWLQVFVIASSSTFKSEGTAPSSSRRRIEFRALEILSLSEYQAPEFAPLREAALGLIIAAATLDASSTQPLIEAIQQSAPTSPELLPLFQALSKVRGGASSRELRRYLSATDPRVREVVARTLVHNRADVEDLRPLLLHRSPDVALAAAYSLGEGMSASQSEVVIGLLGSGQLGRGSAARVAMSGARGPLSAENYQKLRQLWSSQWPRDRSWLIPAATRIFSLQDLEQVVKGASPAERIQFVQMLAFRGDAFDLLLKLAKDPSDRIVALAIESLAEIEVNPQRVRGDVLFTLTEDRPLYVRAAAYRALRRIWSRSSTPPKKGDAARPDDLLSQDDCQSQNPGLVAAAWGLASEFMLSCGREHAEHQLLFHPDARVRLEIARGIVLSRSSAQEKQTALAACAHYEAQADIAALCLQSVNSHEGNLVDIRPDSGSGPLPYAPVNLEVPWMAQAPPLFPFLLVIDGRPRAVVSNPDGETFVSGATIQVLDAGLVY